MPRDWDLELGTAIVMTLRRSAAWSSVDPLAMHGRRDALGAMSTTLAALPDGGGI